MKSSRASMRNHLTSILVALLVVLLAIGIWRWHRHSSTDLPPPAGSSIKTAPSDQGAKRSTSTPSSTLNQGGANDKNGQTPTVTSNPSQWVVSTSGLLTLKEPVKGSLFKKGDAIYGSSSVNPVHFRLIDNQVGVIAQGTINVINGNFSATADFKSYGTTGRLDVFNTDASGREINEVQVPINF